MGTNDEDMQDEGSDGAPAQVAAVKTAEEWAELRGHFPEFRAAPRRPDKPEAIQTPIHNPAYRLYRQAFFVNGWVLGKEMTLAQYDAAVAHADDPNNHVFR
jgi:hypothetical protein